MASCLLRDRLEELWLQIDQLHLTYLEADESPRKLDEKKRLEAYIREYLCIAPHDRKFCLEATREVLHRSVESKEDFSAYRATEAWSAIAAYAHNLLAQPWRKEYHEIKTYSGYYKHHVESGLVGAELILEAMGYKHTSNSTLILDGPVDPDRVATVSQDSLIALVECQIMRQIYAEVLKVVPTCSWSDVLRFREQHAGSPEQAIRCLNYRLHQEQYQMQHIDSCGGPMVRYPPYPHPHPYAMRYTNYSYATQPRYGQSMVTPAYQHPHYPDRYFNYYSVRNGCIPYAVPPAMPVPCSVPTAQLIELDATPSVDTTVNTHRRSSSDHRIEASDFRKNGGNTDRIQNDYYSRHHDNNYGKKTGKSKSDWDWEYVYKTLEGKKTGVGTAEEEVAVSDRWERRERERESKCTSSPQELDDALKAFSLDDLHQITLPDTRLKKMNNESLNSVKVSNHEDELASLIKNTNNVINRGNDSLYSSGGLTPLDTSNSPKRTQNATVVNSVREPKKPEKEEIKFIPVDARNLRVKLSEDKWECVTCTYHNLMSREVCEMCGKSKKVGDESRPLASGGRQCPHCTLVNEKGVTTCEVCGNSLKDSATYI